MKYSIKALVVTIVLALTMPAVAVKIEFHTFENKQQEKLFTNLIAELRCVKCQNQNLAESNAELAKDMRDKTYQMILAGKTRQDVVNYMTARYGDFVLYNPPFKAKTLLLWVGPPLLLILSLFMLLKKIRNSSRKQPEKLSDAERESVRNALKTNSSSEK